MAKNTKKNVVSTATISALQTTIIEGRLVEVDTENEVFVINTKKPRTRGGKRIIRHISFSSVLYARELVDSSKDADFELTLKPTMQEIDTIFGSFAERIGNLIAMTDEDGGMVYIDEQFPLEGDTESDVQESDEDEDEKPVKKVGRKPAKVEDEKPVKKVGKKPAKVEEYDDDDESDEDERPARKPRMAEHTSGKRVRKTVKENSSDWD